MNFIIASTWTHDEILEWLNYLNANEGMSELSLPSLAAKRCYNSVNTTNNENIHKVRASEHEIILNLLKQRHGSVFEHFNITAAFENVSRVFTHELVRHRAGMAYSQESLRYVNPKDLKLKMTASMRDRRLALLKNNVDIAFSDYKVYLESFKDSDFYTKKEQTSLARRFLPMGISTAIIATGNVRAWRNIFHQRCTEHAEEEIRTEMRDLLHKFQNRWPGFFGDIKDNGETTFYKV
jgi:thymidylate synthase (FAD)